MSNKIFICFQKYKHYSNLLSARIIVFLQNYCNTINPSENNDVWKPILNGEILYSISNILKNVLRKNNIHTHNIDESFTDYAAQQIAHYIFNKLIDNNDVLFKLHTISLDEILINPQIQKINNTTLDKFKNDFCNIHGRPVDINTIFVIDKYFLESKFHKLITTTINNIDYNTVVRACYNGFKNQINKSTPTSTHPNDNKC